MVEERYKKKMGFMEWMFGNDNKKHHLFVAEKGMFILRNKINNEKKTPIKMKNIDQDISNFDHEIPEGLEEKLKSGDFYCDYPAWNFHGTVFYNQEKKLFQCEVMQYQSHVDTIVAPSLKEIMKLASDKYGYE